MLRRAVVLSIAAAATGLAVIVTIPAVAQTAVNYVALGDSYSSGLGAGSSGSCERSPSAYPARWAQAHSPASFTFAACSGATTASVISGQLSALNSGTTLVSITVGGNDVGFSSVMATCVLFSTGNCVSAIGTAEGEMSTTLPAALDRVLSAIASAAPNARVVVLGYPELYDLAKSGGCIGLSTTDRTDLNHAADELDGQIRAAASRHGDVYADVRAAFGGHEICDPVEWLHSVDWLALTSSYHPNASGQSGAYYPVFSSRT